MCLTFLYHTVCLGLTNMDFGGIVLDISSLCFTYTMVLYLCFSPFFLLKNKSIWTLVVHITSKGVQNEKKMLLIMLDFNLPLVSSISHQLGFVFLFFFGFFYLLLTTLENFSNVTNYEVILHCLWIVYVYRNSLKAFI